jgi:hypothetical protein
VLDAHSAGASDDPLAARPAVIANVSGATSARGGWSENGDTSLDIVGTVPAVRRGLLDRAIDPGGPDERGANVTS